jgi:hypothetical protein
LRAARTGARTWELDPRRPVLVRDEVERQSVTADCPVCGRDNVAVRCGHDPCFIDDIREDEVLMLTLDLWEQVRRDQAARESGA